MDKTNGRQGIKKLWKWNEK